MSLKGRNMFDVKTRVLIVDDMTTMRKIVVKLCKEIGFTDLTEASDGALAWAAVTSATQPFGLIISDWNMPNCTGIDFLRRVRGDSRFGNTPFLMLTAESEQHQVEAALDSGVDNYVIKPFNSVSLKASLETVFKKYAA
jgi:two-component system chemotaxis response regulator CheY